MPHDAPHPIVPPPPLARSWPRSLALLALIAATSLAVGATTSFWLVPPYLLLMGWLLFAPAARPEPPAPSAVPSEAPSASAPAPEPEPAAVPPPSGEVKTPKTRAKGRPRAKAKPKVDEPPPLKVEATWVQVAPGKFVRVERPVVSPAPEVLVPDAPALPAESLDPAEGGSFVASPAFDATEPGPSIGEPLPIEVVESLPPPSPDAPVLDGDADPRGFAPGRPASEACDEAETFAPVYFDADPPSGGDSAPEGAASAPLALLEVRASTEPAAFDPATVVPELSVEADSSEDVADSTTEDDADRPAHQDWLDEGTSLPPRDGPAEDSGRGTALARPMSAGGGARQGSPHRAFRVRRDPRPRLRRGNGRVGASPRVVPGRA